MEFETIGERAKLGKSIFILLPLIMTGMGLCFHCPACLPRRVGRKRDMCNFVKSHVLSLDLKEERELQDLSSNGSAFQTERAAIVKDRQAYELEFYMYHKKETCES